MAAGKKSEATKIKILERQRQALQLRKNGVSYRLIGDQLSISHVQAQRDIKAALELSRKDVRQEAETYRALELERLDDMLFNINNQVRSGHLGAIDRALKIMERRAKLLGLDAPEKLDWTSDGEKIGLTINIGSSVEPPE